MTLGFSTKLNGQPNYFVEKIICALFDNNHYVWDLYLNYNPDYRFKNFIPKLHTLRDDAHDRWRAGRNIHAVINNRTKKRYQFAPVFKCISTQLIRIDAAEYQIYVQEANHYRKLDHIAVEYLAVNDGFKNSNELFAYFKNSHSNLKLIHWTDLKY